MKEKILLISGCSHAAGSEIHGTEDSPENRQMSFGNILARKLGRTAVNLASCGCSNSSIARNILDYVSHYYDRETTDLMVLCAWTSPLRIEIPWKSQTPYHRYNFPDYHCMANNLYVRINVGGISDDPEIAAVTPYYHEYIAKNTESVEISYTNMVLQIQWFLAAMQIDYLMCNTMEMYTRTPALNFYLALIDTDKYLYPFDNDQAFYPKYRSMGYENSLAKYWHHGAEPHRLYADELYNFYMRSKNAEATS
jgi:hypothetical protein